jgi:hypothetical protein
MMQHDDLGIVDITAERFSEGEIQGFLWFLLACLFFCILSFVIAAVIQSGAHQDFRLSLPKKKPRSKMRKIDEGELSKFNRVERTPLLQRFYGLLSLPRKVRHDHQTRSSRSVPNKQRRDSARVDWRSQGSTNTSWPESGGGKRVKLSSVADSISLTAFSTRLHIPEPCRQCEVCLLGRTSTRQTIASTKIRD